MPELMTKEEITRRQKKTRSVRHLAGQIEKLRSQVNADMKSKDEKIKMTALAVALMDKTAERVGNDASAKDGHFGVTGWQGKHLSVSGSKVTLKYVGKSGVDHEKSFTDKKIATLLKECQARCKKSGCLLCTEDGFKITAPGVNKYLKQFGITAKDIRGYAANTLMVNELKGSISSDKEEREKKFKEAIKEVAAKVGHQAATLKKHYLLPGIEKDYVGGGRLPSIKKASCDRDESQMSMRVASAERVAREYVEDIRKGRMVYECIERMMPEVYRAYREVMGVNPKLMPIRIGINDWDLPDGKVGSLKFPAEDGGQGILTVSPNAFDEEGAPYWWVTTHELIHAALGNATEEAKGHNEDFRAIAELVGVPERYMD